MNRKVDYILTTIRHLTKKDKLKDVLNQIKEINHYHYVATPNGGLITLKDPEQNNTADTETYKIECIHVLILLPEATIFNLIIYAIFCAYRLHKKMSALGNYCPDARVLDEEWFYDDCLRKLEREVFESGRKLFESERRLADLESKLRDLKDFGMNDYHQN